MCMESLLWPMEQALHSFWFDRDRRPTWTKKTHYNDHLRFLALLETLTPLQTSCVQHIQVFAQMYWLEESLGASPLWNPSVYNLSNLTSFTVTIRHSDW